jgi:hypothetical protein
VREEGRFTRTPLSAVAVVVAAAWFAAELFYWLIDGDEGGGDE